MIVIRMISAGLALALISAPLTAQSIPIGPTGNEFIKAVRERDGRKLNDLLANNPKGLINARNAAGDTALSLTIGRSDSEWTAFLLTKGADPELAARNGDTPLILASRIGFTEAVKWLLEYKARVDLPNRMGETPLIAAVQQRRIPVVRMLLNAGADPDKKDSAAGLSARDYAERDRRTPQILRMIEDKKPKLAILR